MTDRISSPKLLTEGSSVRSSTHGKGLEIEFTSDSNGVITGSTILNGGIDYTNNESIFVDHPTGTGANITVGVNGSGTVTSVNIISGGSDYFDIGVLYAPSMIMATLVELDWYDVERDTPDPMYLTSAFNNIRWYTSADFTEYKEFMALGNLGEISAIEEGFDLQSYGITLRLSGIPLEIRREAFASTSFTTAFQNRACKVYAVYLDRNYNIMGEPITLFSGQMDACTISVAESIDIEITVESRLINWEIPRGGRYNTNDQQVWYPDDTGFDLIPSLINKELDWGGDGTGNTGVLGDNNTGGGGGNNDQPDYRPF